MRGYEREQTRKDLMDHRLADSLKVLIRQEPLEKITIKQITDDAGVVRPTFYQHFADKYRLDRVDFTKGTSGTGRAAADAGRNAGCCTDVRKKGLGEWRFL